MGAAVGAAAGPVSAGDKGPAASGGNGTAASNGKGGTERLDWAQLYPTLVVLVAALALVLRVANVMMLLRAQYPLVEEPILDAEVYDGWARAILEGGEAARRSFFFPPLFAYLEAGLYRLVGPRPLAVTVANTGLDALNVVLVCLAGSRAFGRRVGLLAGLFYALYLPAVFHAATPFKTTTEVFTGLVLLLCLVSADRRPAAWKWAACGLALGAAVLARPNLLVAAPVLPLAAALAWRRVGWRRAAAYALLAVLALGLVLGAVTARNLVVLGEPGLFTNGGIAFYLSVNNFLRPDFVPGAPAAEEQAFLQEYLQRSGRDYATSSESSAYWMRQALKIFRARPLQFLGLLERRLIIFFNAAEIGDCYSLDLAREKSGLLQLPLLSWWLLTPLALAGGVLGWGAWSRGGAAAGGRARGGLFGTGWGRDLPPGRPWPYCLLFLAYTLSLATIFPVDRYRLPAVPLVATLAAWSVWALVAWARRVWASPGRRRWLAALGLLTWLAVAGAAGLFVNLGIRFFDFDRGLGQHLLNLGDVLATRGRLAEAEAYDLRALQLWPQNPAIYYSLGLIFTKTGRPRDAVACLERAVALNPSSDAYHQALDQARRDAAGGPGAETPAPGPATPAPGPAPGGR